MFFAINMGGSGTAPSFAASYGAKLLHKRLIPALFGLFVFAGAVIAGSQVSATIGKGLIPESYMSVQVVSIILLSTALSMLFANLLNVPQSTSQATIMSITSVGLFYGVFKPEKLFFEMIPTWFITPLIAFFTMYIIGKFIYNPLRKKELIDFQKLSEMKFLKFFVIGTSCYVAFSIGSNNVANAAGPLMAMLNNEMNTVDNSSYAAIISLLSVAIVAPCFGIGSSIFGGRVLKTTGNKIISFGPLGASAISLVTATLLLIASVSKGIPTSLVQMNIGAILGLGMSKVGGKEIFSKSSVKKVFITWIIAPCISFGLAYFFCFLAGKILS